MNFPSTRGEITLALLLLLAIGGGGFLAGHHFTKIDQKEKIEALSTQAADADAKARTATEALQTATTAHDKAMATVQDKEQAVSGFVKGTDIALAAEPAPSINVRIARTLNQSAADTLPPATAAQTAEFKAIIADLVAKNATTSDALAAKQKEAGDYKTASEQAAEDARIANAKAIAAAKEVRRLTGELKARTDELAKLATDHVTLWGWVKRIGYTLLGLWLASLVLPVMAKAFPVLQPLAAVFGAVWSPGVQLISSGARTLTGDMVALHEFVKGHLAKTFTPEQMAAFKTEVKQWWDGDVEAQSEIEQVKARTLRA